MVKMAITQQELMLVLRKAQMFEKQVYDTRTTLDGGSTTNQHGDATTT